MLETCRLSEINTTSRSILPTGKMKIVHDLVLQEAEVIVHRKWTIKSFVIDREESREFDHGVYTLWFPIPEEFIKSIRSGKIKMSY